MPKAKIRATVTYGNKIQDTLPEDDGRRKAHPYTVVLRYRGRQMTVPFWTGSGWDREPTAADVFSSVVMDAQSYWCATDYYDWCENLDQTPSRETQECYDLCGKYGHRLLKFLAQTPYFIECLTEEDCLAMCEVS